MKRLSDREVAILRVLTTATVDERERGMYSGRIGALAGFKYSQRRDAGATKTLDSMAGKGFVRGTYDRSYNLAGVYYSGTSRRWWVTEAGRAALGEYAFGE